MPHLRCMTCCNVKRVKAHNRTAARCSAAHRQVATATAETQAAIMDATLRTALLLLLPPLLLPPLFPPLSARPDGAAAGAAPAGTTSGALRTRSGAPADVGRPGGKERGAAAAWSAGTGSAPRGCERHSESPTLWLPVMAEPLVATHISKQMRDAVGSSVPAAAM